MKRVNVMGRPIVSSMALAFVVLLFVGCNKNLTTTTDSVYVPTAADATATATLADLEAGRSIYINYCGKCHMMYATANVPASVIPNMASRSGLSATQTSQVTKFINLRK